LFANAIQSGGVVRAINAGAHELPRSALDELTDQAKGPGARDCGGLRRGGVLLSLADPPKFRSDE